MTQLRDSEAQWHAGKTRFSEYCARLDKLQAQIRSERLASSPGGVLPVGLATHSPKADVTVLLEKWGDDHKFIIRKGGDGPAHHVTFDLAVEDAKASPLIPSDYEEKMPIAKLAPGGECPLWAAFAFGMPTSFQGEWSWRNDDGSVRRQRSTFGI